MFARKQALNSESGCVNRAEIAAAQIPLDHLIQGSYAVSHPPSAELLLLAPRFARQMSLGAVAPFGAPGALHLCEKNRPVEEKSVDRYPIQSMISLWKDVNPLVWPNSRQIFSP